MAAPQVTPTNCVFQGKAGGWPGFPTFTDPTQIYVAGLSVNWSSGLLAYTFAAGFPIPQQGSVPQTFFVTLADPSRLGGSNGQIFIDSDAGRWTQAGQANQPFAALGVVQVYPGVTGLSSGAFAPSGTLVAQNNSADLPTTAVLTAAQNPNGGMYLIVVYVVETTAPATSCTVPFVQLSWTDEDTGVATVGVTGNVPITISNSSVGAGQNESGLTTQSKSPCMAIVRAAPNTAINVSTSGYASNPAAAMKFALYAKAFPLGA